MEIERARGTLEDDEMVEKQRMAHGRWILFLFFEDILPRMILLPLAS